MTPRPRKRGRKDLPENLYAKTVGSRTYFQYRHPVTHEFIGFGYNKHEAVEAAKQLNHLLIKQTSLVDKVILPDNPIREYLENYREKILPSRRVNGQPLSSRTLGEYQRIIKTLISELGHHSFATIRQSDIAEYLNDRSTAEVYNKHRSLLIMIFRQAISDEKISINLAERVIKRDADSIKRAPLTLDHYNAIYQHATTPIRNAMELSLNALQRRTDIQRWRFDSKITDENGQAHYRIIISKTKKHGKQSYLEIPANMPVAHSAAGAKTLEDIIRNCRDDLVSPHLIHQQPQRRKPSKEKEHSMQLSPGEISKGFAAARDAAGITQQYKHPPTYHELLALGQSLREQHQGWTTEDCKKLRGHSKITTTQRYRDRQIDWTRFEIPGTKKAQK
ncbi:phage integrase Arm DNA-binding domain-containing protein [Methylophaga lonarensis]|uniref:phage integrase Arm DNA-binding domain-containing protein n=1 Tax=Methylophaga lonarensis TaxID=999151 RepID=UPI003D29421D